MPIRKRKKIGDWHGDRWGPVVGRAIERRLHERRALIAELLGIDLEELEWRNNPPDIPDDGRAFTVADYVEWRHTPPTGGAFQEST